MKLIRAGIRLAVLLAVALAIAPSAGAATAPPAVKVTPSVGSLALSWPLPTGSYAAVVKWRTHPSGPWSISAPAVTSDTITGLSPVPTDVQVVLLPSGGVLAATATPTVAVPSHTETWAYDDCGNGGVGASSALVRQWVSYAETNCGPGGDAKALTDCHAGGVTYCQVMQYLDTNLIYYTAGSASPQWSPWSGVAAEGWYLHQPSSTARVATSAFGGGYFDNQTNGAVQAFYQSYVRAHYPNEDGLFMDDQGAGVSQQFYGSNSSSSSEVTTDTQLQAAHAAMSAALTRPDGTPYPQVDNTLPDCGNPFETEQGLSMIAKPVVGLLAEGCPTVNGALNGYYLGMLDDMAYVNASTSGFTALLSYGQAGASYQQKARRIQEATVLLGYAPGRVVDWAELEQGNSNLAVWPEEGIYPTGPLQTMASPAGAGCFGATGAVCSTGGHNDLQVSAGVVRREFSACYDQGAPIGPCAAVVNTTGAAVTIQPGWLSRSYGHQVAMTGGDIQAGGTVSVTGPAAASVGAQDAVLLTP